MRRMGYRLALVTWGLWVGCGGATKKEATPPSIEEEPAEEGQGSDAEAAPPEKLDELAQAFRMKQPQVARCYSEAAQAGKIDRRASGRVTVSMTISAVGKATDVKISETTLRNQAVEDCVVRTIQSWILPEPGTATPFSFSYEFESEFASGPEESK